MIPDVAITFELDGTRKCLEYRKVPFTAWDELKQATDYTPKTLFSGISDFDVSAMVSVVWLERKQREKRLQFREAYQQVADDPPEFELLDLSADGRSVFGDEDTAEVEVDEDPPTGSG